MDPVLHAEMTQLLRDEKEYVEERTTLVRDFPTWKKRVELATNKGMLELAEEAQGRVDEMHLRISEIDIELEMIEDKKKHLRYESKRPSGEELRRSSALLNAMKEGGLIDPLEMEIENLTNNKGNDSDLVLDFES